MKFKLISFILGFIRKNKQEEIIEDNTVKKLIEEKPIEEKQIILNPNEIICEDCEAIVTAYATDANYKNICLTCYNKKI